jgi:DNA-binding NtrC family response regulator
MSLILVVDDEALIRKSFCAHLASNGFDTCEAPDGVSALEEFSRRKPALVLLDLNMPDMSGMEVLAEIRKRDRDIPVIIVTAYGDIKSAVNAIKHGAYDFLSKPLDLEKLLVTVNRAIEKTTLEKRVIELDNTLHLSLESIMGKSGPLRKIVDSLCRIASTDYSVVILGETGTGKTFLAKTLHGLSKRAEKPFVKVSIGSMAQTLVESELFGYEKGAFTGADKNKKGHFETAQGGTLFIDDMDNIPPPVQGKLLSCLEEKKIFRIGDTVPINLDIRILGATNMDISGAIKNGRFREDLFYRLGEFVVQLPPLRERKDDIVFFAEKFIAETCSELNKPACELHEEALRELLSYPWPGNLRQLKNVIRRAVLLSPGSIIEADNIPFLIGQDSSGPSRPYRQGAAPGLEPSPGFSLKESEKEMIRRALEHTGGQKLKAASLLGITYKTLVKKMTDYGIS